MAYLSLYRKFRPITFDEVKGQDHIVTSLKNQVKYNRFAHAYLFCGTRGTGKTSVAKILARAANCTNQVDGNPCGECERCKAALDGSSINVIEMDAASNNGVENIRQINEEVAYPPTDDKYKVYIIDEVHMLSTGAFNALLKTLEEPPEYVIFILATTEYAKIPITILSRCQKYDFKHISVDVIYNRLDELMQKEGNKVESSALKYIAKAADGSMRDALSLLDRCIAFYLGEEITYDKVLDVLGAVDTEIYERLLKAIVLKDINDALGIVEEMVLDGRDLLQLTNNFIWYLRNLLLVKISDNVDEIVDMSSEKIERLKKDSKLFEEPIIMRYIRVLSETSADMKLSMQKRILLETALIKIMHPSMESDIASLQNRIADLEKKLKEGSFVSASAPAAEAETIDSNNTDAEKSDIEGNLAMAVPKDIESIIENWDRLVSNNRSLGMHGALYDSFTIYMDKDGDLCLSTDKNSFAYPYTKQEGFADELESVLSSQVGKQVKVKFVTKNDIINKKDDYKRLNPFNIEIEEED